MTPESIVVGLEQAKKLKEAGWPQVTPQHPTSLFYWAHFIGLEEPALVYAGKVELIRFDEFNFLLSAPTAEEILRRLPDVLKVKEGYTAPLLVTHRAWEERGWYVMYSTGLRYGDEKGEVTSADTLANAASKMWCYLKEQNLLPIA